MNTELPVANIVQHNSPYNKYPFATCVTIVPVMDSVVFNELSDSENNNINTDPFPGLSIQDQQIIHDRLQNLFVLQQPQLSRQRPFSIYTNPLYCFLYCFCISLLFFIPLSASAIASSSS